MKVQKGISLTSDFQKGTWTFEMQDRFSVSAGEFAIIPMALFESKPTFNAELVLTLESKREWVAKVPYNLPEKTKAQQLICLVSNGNCLTIGEDFEAAEEMNSYPVRVYKLQRVAEVNAKIKQQTKG